MKALPFPVLLTAAFLWWATAASQAIGQVRGAVETKKTPAIGEATFQSPCDVEFKIVADQKVKLRLQYQIPAAGWQPIEVNVRIFIGPTPPGGPKPTGNPSLDIKAGADDPTAPDIAGMTYPEAKAALESAGLVLATAAPAPQGKVILQDPAAGSAVAGGTSVTAIFAVDGEQVVVPGLSGMPYPEAKRVLFTVGLVLAADPNALAGNVVSQNPAPGTIVAKGSSVSVVFRVLVSQEGQSRSQHARAPAERRGGGIERDSRELKPDAGHGGDRR